MLTRLIQQLEQAKFARLLRYLLDEQAQTPDLIKRPARAVGTPGAEFLVKHVAKSEGYHNNRTSWIFRPVHLPVNRWDPATLARCLNSRVEAAFADIAKNPDLLDAFSGTDQSSSNGEILDGWGPSQDQFLYTFTNVPHDIAEGPLSALVQGWIDLWDRHLSDVQRPSFGLGSPETLAANASEETEDFIRSLLREPSGYQAIAREGRITVSPFTEHGGFVTAGGGREGSPSFATATATLRSGISARAVQELEDLLNRPGTREKDLQAFLEENPELLGALNPHFVEAVSRIGLVDPSGTRLIPDFMARLDDLRSWWILELKGPDRKPVHLRAGALTPSAKTAAALDQLLRYRDFFHDPENRRKLTSRLGTTPFQPVLTVVIGRGHPNAKFSWRGGPGLPHVDVVTYDHLLEVARQSVSDLEAYERPIAEEPRLPGL